MWATNPSRGIRLRPRTSQAGTTAIEFALLAGLFFTLVFGTIEVARLMFVYNTLQEVTRRAAVAAVNVYPGDTTAIDKVKQDAVFRTSPGDLALAPPVSDQNIRIEYLALLRDTSSGALSLSKIDQSALPTCAAKNRQICMQNPNAANCIRFVQVSVCDTADSSNCVPVKSQMLLPLVDLRLPLHKATTIATAESLGYVAGTAPCP
ncbi:TadE/TadG family type IV pilus assembly protein [Massilia sp. LXY-6]|uniref:TadE/TadG family type IV pilus assembly protein n=1 Tax=Massilia sp. LXY-6 TaxID=3379823 RepID=UPI003EE3F73F